MNTREILEELLDEMKFQNDGATNLQEFADSVMSAWQHAKDKLSMEVTIQTLSDEGRKVTLETSLGNGQTVLLGTLKHGTPIVVNQKLIDDLANLLEKQNEIRSENCACLDCGGQFKCYDGCPNPAHYLED